MGSKKRSVIALGMALSLVFVLVTMLLPAKDVKAAVVFPEVDTNQYGIYQDKHIGRSVNIGTEGQIIRLDKPATADEIIVDPETKTVTFNNLVSTGMDFDDSNAGWTLVFKGVNKLSSRLTVERTTVTIKMDSSAKLTIGDAQDAEGLSGSVNLASGTKSNVDVSSASGLKNVTFTGSAESGGQGNTSTGTSIGNIYTLADGLYLVVERADDGTLTFRYLKDFDLFGGYLLVDGKLVDDSQFGKRPGSTIITLFQDLVSKLSDGAWHTIKVEFIDGETVESYIKINPSTVTTSTTTPSGDNATATAKVKSPKTGDVMPFVPVALVFVGAIAIGVITIRRKNS